MQMTGEMLLEISLEDVMELSNLGTGIKLLKIIDQIEKNSSESVAAVSQVNIDII